MTQKSFAIVPLMVLAGACVRFGFDAGQDSGTPRQRPDADAGQASDAIVDAFAPLAWVTVPEGTFNMGSGSGDPCGVLTFENYHPVTLTRDFEMQATEVTQGSFESLTGYNPSFMSACGEDCPVETVNWHEAAAYCNALSSSKGLSACYVCSGVGAEVTCAEAPSYAGSEVYDCPGYRLPTDAEFERAYRAGTDTPYYNGPNDPDHCEGCDPDAPDLNAAAIGWYCANAAETPHPVGSKLPNAWGLYDLAGNVREWSHDRWVGELGATAVTDPWAPPESTDLARTLRNGSWADEAITLRASYRIARIMTERSSLYGFRCVRSLPDN